MESGVIIISQPCAPINQVEPCATNTIRDQSSCLPSTCTCAGSIKCNKDFALKEQKLQREGNTVVGVVALAVK